MKLITLMCRGCEKPQIVTDATLAKRPGCPFCGAGFGMLEVVRADA